MIVIVAQASSGAQTFAGFITPTFRHLRWAASPRSRRRSCASPPSSTSASAPVRLRSPTHGR